MQHAARCVHRRPGLLVLGVGQDLGLHGEVKDLIRYVSKAGATGYSRDCLPPPTVLMRDPSSERIWISGQKKSGQPAEILQSVSKIHPIYILWLTRPSRSNQKATIRQP
jgi:hypothetical protein